MKKKYTAPGIYFESFSLSAAVTVNCDTVIDTQSLNMCGVDTGIQYIFFDSMTSCRDGKGAAFPFPIPKDDDGFNGLCYHVPTEGNQLFNS